MRKIWVILFIALLVIGLIGVAAYYQMDSMGYFDKQSVTKASNDLALGTGIGGGVFISILKFIWDKVMQIVHLVISILIALFAFCAIAIVSGMC